MCNGQVVPPTSHFPASYSQALERWPRQSTQPDRSGNDLVSLTEEAFISIGSDSQSEPLLPHTEQT